MNKIEKIMNKLSSELLKVEERNIDFFKERKSKFERDEHDRLHNHWISHFDGYFLKFGFTVDSDLPEYLKIQCVEVYKQILNEEIK